MMSGAWGLLASVVVQAVAMVGLSVAVLTLVWLVAFDDVVIPRRDDGDR